MTSFQKAVDALGRGDPALARRMTATALLVAGPTFLIIAIFLALGTGQ